MTSFQPDACRKILETPEKDFDFKTSKHQVHYNQFVENISKQKLTNGTCRKQTWCLLLNI
jgi:hypothetical protein